MISALTPSLPLTRQEACSRLCIAQSHKLQQIVETCTCVIDVKDMMYFVSLIVFFLFANTAIVELKKAD